MTSPAADPLIDLSAAIEQRVRAATPLLAGIGCRRGSLAGILWRSDLIVASEQSLPEEESYTVTMAGGAEIVARPAGRDPGTNVALLRLTTPAEPAAAPSVAHDIAVGAVVLVLGVAEGAAPTARLGIVRATGPAWHSMAGGRIDRLLKLDLRFGWHEDGGPAVDASGRLLGMATAGPRGRGLVIPSATIERVIEPLLAQGRIGRGWIGVGLQPVATPEALRDASDQKAGLMVMSLVAGGPAEQAGLLPGDILLTLDGRSVVKPRMLGAMLGADRIGQPIEARLLRAGSVVTHTITIGARPAE